MDDFKEVMQWCSKFKVAISIEAVDDEHFMLTAHFPPLLSEALFTSQDNLVEALYFATSSLKTGFEFHSKNGFVPPRLSP